MTSERVERRLAAILAGHVAGYSRLMAVDEVGTLETLKAHRREVVDPSIAEHKGRIVKTTGNGMLVEFGSAVDAVTCAIAIQEKMAERSASGPEPRIRFRIGINVGDIIIDGGDFFGDGVNVAAPPSQRAPRLASTSSQIAARNRRKTCEWVDAGTRRRRLIFSPQPRSVAFQRTAQLVHAGWAV